MKKIYFGTTNQGKIDEAKEILGIKVEGLSHEAEEIQSLDLKEVTKDKAKKYFKKYKKPLIVEDVGLTFKALGKLPGTYIKDFSKSLGNSGLTKLLNSFKDRSAVAETQIAYIDSRGKVQIFSGKVYGTIAKKPRGKHGFGWDPIFIPKGSNKTFAEIKASEKNKYSMRKKALLKFKKAVLK